METWEQAVLWLRSSPRHDDLVRAAFFDDPVSAAAARYYASSEWLALRRLLPTPVGKTLDLGAGRGIASYALARDGWQVTAVEPDPSDVVGAGAIRLLAAETNVAIEIVTEWGEALPILSESFDLVLCRQALHHARDLKALCAEVHRVLRPGGTLVATREHVLTRRNDLDVFLKAHPLHYRYGGEHAYTLKEYTEAIESAGLRLLRLFNPLQSDVNTFPRTTSEIRERIAARLHIPVRFVPSAALTLIGMLDNTPGRLYTFIANKQVLAPPERHP